LPNTCSRRRTECSSSSRRTRRCCWDFLDDPAAVRVVQRSQDNGTTVLEREDPDGIRKALDESGFGLGEYYETRGFGAQL